MSHSKATTSKSLLRLLSLSDQIMFSAANFLLTIMLAHHYSEVELAGYGIGLSVALIIQGIQRNCYIVQNAVLPPPVLRRRARKLLGEQFIVWGGLILLEIIACLIAYYLEAPPYYWAILISTLVASLIYAQLDFDRIIMIKLERYRDPLVMSLLFLLLNGALFLLIPRLGISFAVTMLLLGSYATLKILWLVFAVGTPDFAHGWLLARRDMRRYLKDSVIGVIGFSGHNHVPLFILGSVAAPIQSAAFVAMRGLMQPLQVVVRSLDIVDKNFFHASSDMRTTLLRQLLLYLAISVAAILALALFGEPLIRLVYGEKYTGFASILLGWGFIFAMLAISFPLETVIVKQKKLNAYNRYRILSGVIGTILALILCETYGATGAVIACFSGWLVSIFCALWLIRPVFSRSTA